MFDVEASQALSAAQKRRVLAKAGATIRAVAQDERSQLRNRELALERLTERLREALRVERRRVATKPSRAAVERRLEDKRRRSATKRLRRCRRRLGRDEREQARQAVLEVGRIRVVEPVDDVEEQRRACVVGRGRQLPRRVEAEVVCADHDRAPQAGAAQVRA